MKKLMTVFFLIVLGYTPISAIAAGNDVIAPVEVPDGLQVEPPSTAEIHESFPDRPCSSCHSPINREVESKLPSHFVTNKECGDCHYTQRWIPLKIYSHIGARYRRPNDADPQECKTCHTANNQFQFTIPAR